MSLREHLEELRRRLAKAGIAVLAGSVAGWFLYPPLFQRVEAPLTKVAKDRGIVGALNFSNITQAFNLHLEIAVYLGLVIASPVWLYQLWAFVVPGLTSRERRTGLAITRPR